MYMASSKARTHAITGTGMVLCVSIVSLDKKRSMKNYEVNCRRYSPSLRLANS